MSDIYIFCGGLMVSLVVGSAVCLLFWGAAHEPAELVHATNESDPLEPWTSPDQSARTAA